MHALEGYPQSGWHAVLAITDAVMYIEDQLRGRELPYRSHAASMERSMITRAAAFLALILIPSLSSAAIYKCTAQDGSITYTDVPCPVDTTTQYVDPAAPAWLNASPQYMNASAALPEATSQSEPESIAILCANDEFKVWLKAQRHGLPDRDTRTAKFTHLSYLCRRALHLSDVAPPISPVP
jgi:Domain of unknown function (DUF4124)